MRMRRIDAAFAMPENHLKLVFFLFYGFVGGYRPKISLQKS